jgi:hypothetical protein
MIGGLALCSFLSLAWFRSGNPAAGVEPVPAAAADARDDARDDADREIFRARMAWAKSERLDTLPLGEIAARLGRTFVGTTYTPNTLDVDGTEHLVINLRELDCVTFVENMLAMARMVEAGSNDFDAYRAELTRIRYRGGVLDGYPSRLHYFSDWIFDNQAKGVVRDVTRTLGGVQDTEKVDFMSTHPASYRQLADPANLAAIRRTEQTINGRARYYIPEDRIAEAASGIKNGDVIAATSTVKGLDVAHTGLALWVNGKLHLLHAPLVGKSVEISELPIAERIRGIKGQDGIMVARPVGRK